ncbi:hypothetical protein ElyMa_002219500 [Elysia marginata]|uniref:Uncharacterized protein n=1 Tax=Elysia marginata TaxID=1093978 RepID=A0AAV4FTK9_9GAST|nr:hypothetical protein ElyMa_002219500 [Elysia marginata]
MESVRSLVIMDLFESGPDASLHTDDHEITWEGLPARHKDATKHSRKVSRPGTRTPPNIQGRSLGPARGRHQNIQGRSPGPTSPTLASPRPVRLT